MILHDPAAATRGPWDLVVIGGGIYGVCVAVEATRRGARPLLLEKGDFGAETSWNSLRIVHGGLRYLQTLDLRRFRESVGERRWFLRHFPDLVHPLDCLMPLYGYGVRRPAVLAGALSVNHLLSLSRNAGVRPDRRISAGRIVGLSESRSLFPKVRLDGLRGSVCWHDAVMPDSQRLLMELLRAACSRGATALNRFEVLSVLIDGGRVHGVAARNAEDDSVWRFQAPLVVNCAGPWARGIARDADRDLPELFRPSIAFNLLFDRPPVARPAVAVAPPGPGGRTYFLTGWKGRLFAGTFHDSADGSGESPAAGEERIIRCIADLNDAVPGLGLKREEVLRIHSGLLPAARDGTADLAVRPVIRDHAADNGPVGLVSISGVKWTTARLVADVVMGRIFPRRKPSPFVRADTLAPPPWPDFRGMVSRDRSAARSLVERILREESVRSMEDLLLRRTDWGSIPAEGVEASQAVTALVGERSFVSGGIGP